MELPEHDKLKEIQPLSQSIFDFIENLKDKHIWLCSRGQDERGWEYSPVTTSLDKLLAEHFGIDLVALEREKEAILNEQRKLNERAETG